MPRIYAYHCNKCEFHLPSGWGGIMYVSNDKGERIACVHPMEEKIIDSVLGRGLKRLFLTRRRTGFSSDCICLDCLSQFRLDVDKDVRECPSCKSRKMKTVSEMIGEPCPKCKIGIIEKIGKGIS